MESIIFFRVVNFVLIRSLLVCNESLLYARSDQEKYKDASYVAVELRAYLLDVVLVNSELVDESSCIQRDASNEGVGPNEGCDKDFDGF